MVLSCGLGAIDYAVCLCKSINRTTGQYSTIYSYKLPALDEKDLKNFNRDKEIVSKFISNMNVID